jgi:phosphate-selective porin OprO/OprP
MSSCRATLLAAALMAASPAALAIDYAPTANLQYDFARFDSDDPRLSDDDAVRRARMGFKAKGATWQFVAEHDFSGNSAADAYLELTPSKRHGFRLGQFKQAFSLEDAISDKSAPLLETSPVGVFAYNRRLGAEYAFTGSRATLNVGAFDQRVDGTQKGRGMTARGTWRLVQDTGHVLHVGASLAADEPDARTAAFSIAPGTALTDVRIARTGTLRNVERIDRAAVEGVWIRGPASLQAEAAQVRVDREGAAGFDAGARTVTATWSPTGHARTYKRGVPGSHGGDHGAWELALRWSAVDLSDAGIAGGDVRSLGFGASWFPNAHVRLAANVVRTTRSGAADDPLLAALRIQFVY